MKSIDPFQSMIQTDYDIVKAPGGTVKVETLSAEAAALTGKQCEEGEF